MKFVAANPQNHYKDLVDLNLAHLRWVLGVIDRAHGIDTKPLLSTLDEYVEDLLKNFSPYQPPKGIWYLLQIQSETAGMGALRYLSPETGEIKRMYLRPSHRGKGYGRALLNRLLTTAKEYGYQQIYLDTAIFMTPAYTLYKSAGFQDRKIYPETEVPQELWPIWRFMEKTL